MPAKNTRPSKTSDKSRKLYVGFFMVLMAVLIGLSVWVQSRWDNISSKSEETPQKQAEAVKETAETKDEGVPIVVAQEEKETLSSHIIPEEIDDDTVEYIDNGASFASTLSYDATVAYYKELIENFAIEGKEDTIDTEALGIQQGWKYDGVYEERLFSVTVARSESGAVGVALIY